MKVFEGIGELITLSGVVKKSGKRIVEKDLGRIRNGVLVVDKGRILWAGSQSMWVRQRKGIPGISKAKKVNLEGRTVIPGFVESHTHSVFAGDRSKEFEMRMTGVSYEDIAKKGGGILSTVKATRKASLNHLTEDLKLRVNRFVKQGVTTLEVKSGYGLNSSSEIKMLKAIRSISSPKLVSTFLGAHAIPPEFPNAGKYIDYLIADTLPKVVKAGLADRADIFIEKGYFDSVIGEKYLRACRDAGLDICVHTEQLNLTQGYQLAIDQKAKSVEHVVQLDAKGISEMAKSETVCVLLPAADFYLKMAYPSARKLIDGGARVALATDFNPGSSPTQDLSLVGVLARIEMGMSLPEVISAYTFNAAKALSLESEVGAILPGYSADFVVLDDGWDRLFYSVGYHPVHSTFWKGKRVF